MKHPFLPALLLLLLHAPQARSQTCSSSISETIFASLNSLNPIFTTSITSTNAQITTSATLLTSSAASSFGGFRFSSPTDFQSTGGFSTKFTIQATDISGGPGDAWDMFIAPQTSFDIVAPPFAPGSASNGKGGWSRSPGLVVELDAYDSGAEEQDGGGGEHVAVFLSGGKICETNVGVSFASGEAYTVWIDYDGFGTKLYVSMSTSGTRPSAPTLTCLVDVWATLDMSVDHYVGFSAYNPTDATGSVHELVESLSIADGYRPFDSSECGSYAKCSERGAQGLCVADLNGAGSCEVIACKGGWIWDVAGADCCAFLERSLWTSDIAAGSVSVGTTVSCVQQRRVMGYVTSADKCA